MPRFPEQFVQQVQQATDIVELVGQYVALKKRGKEFVGICPFHEDHAPSMYVSPTKQIFKCFACGAGGSAFNFLMLYEKLPFTEAVRNLADRAHIPLPQDKDAPAAPAGLTKNDLLNVMTFASKYFQAQLRSPAGKAALDYAHKRGFTDESIQRFGLGYSPDSWDALLVASRRQGITERQLLAAGLVARKDDGNNCYDRFRNRLIFPIHEVSGAIIAFGGRALAAEERAKYLNSPETQLFDKSANLYALNWARDAISTSGTAVVVEGYLDALMPHQAGISNLVATLGTALTDRHVRLLSRYARDVVLLFDADTAGAAATQRAMETFLTQQINVRVTAVPSGKDPCDYVLSDGPDALRKLIDGARDALQFAWDNCYASYQAAGGNLADRRQIVEEFLKLVASSSAYGAIDEIRRGQLAQHIGHMLNIPSADLQQQMRRLSRQISRPAVASHKAGQTPAANPCHSPGLLAERHLLEVLLNRPELYDQAAERVGPADFTDSDLRTVAQRLWTLGGNGRLTFDEVVGCEELASLGWLVADLATVGERRGNYEATLTGAVADLQYRRNRDEMEQMKSSGLEDEDTLRIIQQRHKQADRRRMPRIT